MARLKVSLSVTAVGQNALNSEWSRLTSILKPMVNLTVPNTLRSADGTIMLLQVGAKMNIEPAAMAEKFKSAGYSFTPAIRPGAYHFASNDKLKLQVFIIEQIGHFGLSPF